MKYFWIYEYPVGPVGIAEDDGRIVGVFFGQMGTYLLSARVQTKGTSPSVCETPLIKKAAKQLTEYFAGRRTTFDLPLEFRGTDFQKKVWEALMTIPYGETSTYGEIAKKIKNPNAARAVGMANNRNPIVIICPCHRVIGSDGSLTGYGGGLPNKEYLLRLEGAR